MLLSAPTPAEWLATHLAARFEQDEGSGENGAVGRQPRWLSRAALLADGAAVLADQHERLVTNEGVPAAAAATYLAGWVAGLLAEAVGYGLATADAGFVVTPELLRWRQHPEGWMAGVDLGATQVVVTPGHRWCGQAGVVTPADATEGGRLAVTALVSAVEPVIEACHGLARVGRAGLWNEVADGLGMAVAFQPRLAVDERAVEVLTDAVATPGVPWRARPTLRIAEGASGPAYVAQKGGCCLAYTRPWDEPTATNQADLDGEALAYRERFPVDAATPRYCSTCTFRDPADCQARQLFRLEHLRAARTTTEGANP